VTDSELLASIRAKVKRIMADQRGKTVDAALEKVVQDGIRDAVLEYRSNSKNRIAYETALGAFILEQNPYVTWEKLELPNLPLDPNGENGWVRRSGVLRDYNALGPLPEDEAIPGGMVVNFSYVDRPELADPAPPADPWTKPEGDVPKRTDEPAPFTTKFYPHNVVKTIRLRYLYYDRRYAASDKYAEKNGRDRQLGYILIQYSGNDSNG